MLRFLLLGAAACFAGSKQQPEKTSARFRALGNNHQSRTKIPSFSLRQELRAVETRARGSATQRGNMRASPPAQTYDAAVRVISVSYVTACRTRVPRMHARQAPPRLRAARRSSGSAWPGAYPPGVRLACPSTPRARCAHATYPETQRATACAQLSQGEEAPAVARYHCALDNCRAATIWRRRSHASPGSQLQGAAPAACPQCGLTPWLAASPRWVVTQVWRLAV